MARYKKPTKFTPKYPAKYIGKINEITMRSSWERKFANWCDTNPSVVKWNSEGVPIQYYHSVDRKTRRYFVDFLVMLVTKDGEVKRLIVEVKPYVQTIPPKPPKANTDKAIKNYVDACHTYQQNLDKWNAARQWAKKHDWEFIIMTEYELGIAKGEKPTS